MNMHIVCNIIFTGPFSLQATWVCQHRTKESMGSMPSMNSQPMMNAQGAPMMTTAVPGMMQQNIAQGQFIQQGQPMPLMASQIGNSNIPMGQPLNSGSIPTGT